MWKQKKKQIESYRLFKYYIVCVCSLFLYIIFVYFVKCNWLFFLSSLEASELIIFSYGVYSFRLWGLHFMLYFFNRYLSKITVLIPFINNNYQNSIRDKLENPLYCFGKQTKPQIWSTFQDRSEPALGARFGPDQITYLGRIWPEVILLFGFCLYL